MNSSMVSLVVLSFCAIMPALASAESVKVFLLAGHSNIGGTARADNLTPEWNVPQDDVWIWLDHNIDGVGDWVNLGPGHGGPTHAPYPNDPEGITPGADGHLKVGPELSIGRTLADAFPEDRIAIIKHSGGGGTIGSDWNPENLGPPGSFEHRWSGLLQKTSSAFEALEAAGHSYEVEGFFWSLGGADARNLALPESDAPDEIADGEAAALARGKVYGEGLTNFVSGVREEFGANLPFVMGRMADDDQIEPQQLAQLLEWYPGVPLVRRAQIEVAASDPFTTAFTPAGLTLMDAVHFDAAGQIENGIRFANAYIDLISQSLPGDYNGDGFVNVIDFDLQSLAMSEPNPDLGVFDENTDAMVDLADRNILINDHANTYFGDANLDGEFNSSDFVSVFQTGQYEDGIADNSSWATGDWNGDREFNTSDFVLAFQDGGFEQGPRELARAVPESSGMISGISAVLFFVVRNRRWSNKCCIQL